MANANHPSPKSALPRIAKRSISSVSWPDAKEIRGVTAWTEEQPILRSHSQVWPSPGQSAGIGALESVCGLVVAGAFQSGFAQALGLSKIELDEMAALSNIFRLISNISSNIFLIIYKLKDEE